jgi:hypothetical protein
MKLIRVYYLIAAASLCLLVSGCEGMINGIADNLAHDSEVSDYQRHGVSHRDAERRVFEDNFFDRMDNP